MVDECSVGLLCDGLLVVRVVWGLLRLTDWLVLFDITW